MEETTKHSIEKQVRRPGMLVLTLHYFLPAGIRHDGRWKSNGTKDEGRPFIISAILLMIELLEVESGTPLNNSTTHG
jgi:hypothetical protein